MLSRCRLLQSSFLPDLPAAPIEACSQLYVGTGLKSAMVVAELVALNAPPVLIMIVLMLVWRHDIGIRQDR